MSSLKNLARLEAQTQILSLDFMTQAADVESIA